MKGSQIPFRKNMIQGTAIVLAALVLGIFMVCTVKTLKSYDDTVKVRGLCEKEVPADRVVLRINYSEQDNDLTDLRATMERNEKAVVDLLKKAGFADDEIKYTSAHFNDRYDSYYTGNSIRFRYSASQSINVFTDKMDVVRELERTVDGDLLKQNIISNSYASYEYHGLNDIKPSMIAESLENARSAADEFAKNSHSRIGKMRTASQGYFEVEDLDENTPQVKKVRVVTTVEYYLK
ncbi:MAG: SIMPL domain-containing protein [Bacteroidales bacterium]|nr:SIMPL domain-containing protein [Bacteroidales bacterium]